MFLNVIRHVKNRIYQWIRMKASYIYFRDKDIAQRAMNRRNCRPESATEGAVATFSLWLGKMKNGLGFEGALQQSRAGVNELYDNVPESSVARRIFGVRA